MELRRRTADDRAACLAALAEVQEHDGYPSTPVDLGAFLWSAHETAAWVAVHDGTVVGHVALHAAARSATVTVAQQVTGLAAERHAVLSRLFVAPGARGRGLGRALLRTAVAEADAQGLRAVLDVGAVFAAALRLYEAEGWTRAGTARQVVGDAGLEVAVLLAPDVSRRGAAPRTPPAPAPR